MAVGRSFISEKKSPFLKVFRRDDPHLFKRWGYWYSRWCFFQLFFIFTSTWGRFPIWLVFFKGGWFNHPSRYGYFGMLLLPHPRMLPRSWPQKKMVIFSKASKCFVFPEKWWYPQGPPQVYDHFFGGKNPWVVGDGTTILGNPYIWFHVFWWWWLDPQNDRKYHHPYRPKSSYSLTPQKRNSDRFVTWNLQGVLILFILFGECNCL